MVKFNETELLYTIHGRNIHFFILILVAEGNNNKRRLFPYEYYGCKTYLFSCVVGCGQY